MLNDCDIRCFFILKVRPEFNNVYFYVYCIITCFFFFNLVWENVNVVQYYKRDLVSNLASFVMVYIIYSQQREKESVGLFFCSYDTK